ncbi:hypothetical protein [Nocardia sp. CA-290969]|uniref:hypothetical protein n=1 Tax=Nocardia sp. CA-290969 TaxID=3239986 RepID=UPI003D90088A
MSVLTVLRRASWPMRIFLTAVVLCGAWHTLVILAWAVLGLLGQGWDVSLVEHNLTAVLVVSLVVELHYWRGRALEAHGRRIDVTNTLSIPDGRPTPEFLAAMDREFKARRATRNGLSR